MKEIEFRCKIKGDWGLYRVWSFDEAKQAAYVERNSGFEWVDFDKIQEFMQYTGEKDKNETKIFEGDIMDAGKPICPRCEEKKYRKVSKYLVVFLKGSFRLCWGDSSYTHGIHTFAASMPIIGNKYQNKELLKEIPDLMKKSIWTDIVP